MTFDTREQAVLANEAVRTVLEPTKNSSIPAEEIESNLKLAKEASWEAASKAAAVRNTSASSNATIQTNIESTSVAATAAAWYPIWPRPRLPRYPLLPPHT